MIDTDASAKDIYNFITTSTKLGAAAIQSAVNKIQECDETGEVIKSVRTHTIFRPYTLKLTNFI